jgi:hypothetical protein
MENQESIAKIVETELDLEVVKEDILGGSPEPVPPTDGPALDEAFRVEDVKADSEPTQAEAEELPLAMQEMIEDTINDHLQPQAPDGQRKIGSQDPAHKIHWHGKDMMGNEYLGSGNDARQCNIDAGLLGSCTCHMTLNPAYVEPEAIAAEPEAKPISAFEANDFYRQGYSDGDSAYQDIKALILAWVTDQMVSSSPGAAQDVDSIPFVVYARHNR